MLAAGRVRSKKETKKKNTKSRPPQTQHKQNAIHRFGHVNYEDPYFSVGLPIFSIHGNHDDPTREGGVEALAALDLLHVANLVNYFGKSDKVRVCGVP